MSKAASTGTLGREGTPTPGDRGEQEVEGDGGRHSCGPERVAGHAHVITQQDV